MTPPPGQTPQPAPSAYGTHLRLGLVAVIALVFGLGVWSALASIQGAVIAPATVIVKSKWKKVQHMEGGIVAEIAVRDGDRVAAGDLLIRLDDIETQANLTILRGRLDELYAREARLIAERDGTSVLATPPGLSERAHLAGVNQILSAQQRLLQARQATMRGRRGQLDQRIAQLREGLVGLEAQKSSLQRQIGLIARELESLAGLRKKRLVPEKRVLALEREQARLDGELGRVISEIAQSGVRIGETRLQLLEADENYQSEVLSELREVQTEIAELREKAVAATARLRRTRLLAPKGGIVHLLAVHTIGRVLGAGDTALVIVPEQDRLVLEARLDPLDVDQVSAGQAVVIRFPAFDQRTTPELDGVVRLVSADATPESPRQGPYFTAEVELERAQLARLGELKLVPGMPAEVFIQTGARTVLSYLIKPLSDQISHAFRES